MAKSLDAEMAAIEAEKRKLAERRKAHLKKLRKTAIGTVKDHRDSYIFWPNG